MRDEVLVPVLLKVIRLWEVLNGVTQCRLWHCLQVTGQIHTPAALSLGKWLLVPNACRGWLGASTQNRATVPKLPDVRV